MCEEKTMDELRLETEQLKQRSLCQVDRFGKGRSARRSSPSLIPSPSQPRRPSGRTRWRLLAALSLLMAFVGGLSLPNPDEYQDANRENSGHSAVFAQESLRWSAPTSVDDGPPGSFQSRPTMVMSPNGRAHAIWIDGRHGESQSIYSSIQELGQSIWSSNRLVYQADSTSEVIHLDLALDGLGRLHALWIESAAPLAQDDSDPIRLRIMHSIQARRGMAWSMPVEIDARDDRRSLGAIKASVDPYGTLHIVWEEFRAGSAKIVYNARTFDGSWIGARTLSLSPEAGQHDPQIVSTQSGWTHAVWTEFRAGSSRIMVSQLPPGSRQWTNPRVLDPGGERSKQSHARLASGPDSQAWLAWLDDGQRGRLMAARISRDQGSIRSYQLYAASRGNLLDLALSSGPNAGAFLAWTESRSTPEGNRVYAALIDAEARLSSPSRVDGSRRVDNAGEVSVGYDHRTGLHVLWRAANGQELADIVHSKSSVGAASFERRTQEGYLAYMGRRFNCDMDGFALRSCDPDQPSLLILGQEEALRASLGRYVRIHGSMVMNSACEYLLAEEIEIDFSPCPIDTALVTGIVTAGGEPIEGARVQLGEDWAWTGPSGRYYFDGLEFGEYDLLATADCALENMLGPFSVNRAVNELPPVDLVLGDIVRDCNIDLRDIVRIARLYRSPSPFDPSCADLDLDGQISIFDITRVAGNYELQCPQPWAQAAMQPARAEHLSIGTRIGEDNAELLDPADHLMMHSEDNSGQSVLYDVQAKSQAADQSNLEGSPHLFLEITLKGEIGGLELSIRQLKDRSSDLPIFGAQPSLEDWGEIVGAGAPFLVLKKDLDQEEGLGRLLAVRLGSIGEVGSAETTKLRIDLGAVDPVFGLDKDWLERLEQQIELLPSDQNGGQLEVDYELVWESSDNVPPSTTGADQDRAFIPNLSVRRPGSP